MVHLHGPFRQVKIGSCCCSCYCSKLKLLIKTLMLLTNGHFREVTASVCFNMFATEGGSSLKTNRALSSYFVFPSSFLPAKKGDTLFGHLPEIKHIWVRTPAPPSRPCSYTKSGERGMGNICAQPWKHVLGQCILISSLPRKQSSNICRVG